MSRGSGRAVSFLGLLLIFPLSGCGEDAGPRELIGTWQGDGVQITFSDDRFFGMPDVHQEWLVEKFDNKYRGEWTLDAQFMADDVIRLKFLWPSPVFGIRRQEHYHMRIGSKDGKSVVYFEPGYKEPVIVLTKSE